MKNTMNLDAFSVEELSHTETLENEGGCFPIIPITVGVILLASSCTTNQSNQSTNNSGTVNQSNSGTSTSVSADSSSVKVNK